MNDSLGLPNGAENINEENENPLQRGLHEHDLSEGGEFVSDGIRMSEQVFKARNTSTRRTRYHL